MDVVLGSTLQPRVIADRYAHEARITPAYVSDIPPACGIKAAFQMLTAARRDTAECRFSAKLSIAARAIYSDEVSGRAAYDRCLLF